MKGNKQKIVVFGPGPKFKGGLANYTTSLAKSLDKTPNMEVHLVSWTQQYPAIIPRDFIDRATKVDVMEGTNVKVHYVTNYNRPHTWRNTVNLIADINPDIIVFQWSIAIQGLPLGRIARKLKQKTDVEVIFDLHFVIQKEQSVIDRVLSKYGLKYADSYIAHAYKTIDELQLLYPEDKFWVSEDGSRSTPEQGKTVIKLYHPVYDMFTPDPAFDMAKNKQELNLKENVFLFFGFIRKYKGLHNCIKAFAKLAEKRDDVSLLIVGESFWNTLNSNKLSTQIKKMLFGFFKRIFLSSKESESDYNPLALIDQLGIKDKTTVVNTFVPTEEVSKYFQVSDAILLFYHFATPSGVESMAYNFKMPALATKVGHFPETVKDGFNGYLAEDNDVDDMARVMEKFLNKPISRANVAETARKFSWDNYSKAIIKPLN